MTLRIALAGRDEHEIAVLRSGPEAVVFIDGAPGPVTARPEGGATVLDMDGRRETVWCTVDRDTVFVHAFGRSWRLAVIDPAESSMRAAGGSDAASAPMPGTVVSLAVQAGDQVTRGEVVAVIESMKMHTEIPAPRDGVVERVPVSAGDSFDQGAALVVLAPPADAGPGQPPAEEV